MMEDKRKQARLLSNSTAKKARKKKEVLEKTPGKVETTGCPKGNARGFHQILTHTQRMEEIMEEIVFNRKEKIEEVPENKKEQCRREIHPNNAVGQTQYVNKTSTRKMDNCDFCYNVYSEKLYTSKLERLDLRNTQEENTTWFKQEYHNDQQGMYTENSIVRKRTDKMIQEKQKLLETSILPNLCRDIESELFSRKCSQLRQHQESNDATLNTNTQSWTMRDEVRKTPHENPKTLETNFFPNLGWDIDSEQFVRKGPELRQDQEHNNATLNTHTKNWTMRNKIRKTVHKKKKMIEISKLSLWENNLQIQTQPIKLTQHMPRGKHYYHSGLMTLLLMIMPVLGEGTEIKHGSWI
jgi:hypothetical protein